MTLIEVLQIFPPMSDKFNTFTNDPVSFLLSLQALNEVVSKKWEGNHGEIIDTKLGLGSFPDMSGKEISLNLNGFSSLFYILRIRLTLEQTQI